MASEEAHNTASTSAGPSHYEPKPTVQYTSYVALQAGAFGIVVSALQNALGQHNKGAMGIFTRTGGTIGFFGEYSFIYLSRVTEFLKYAVLVFCYRLMSYFLTVPRSANFTPINYMKIII